MIPDFPHNMYKNKIGQIKKKFAASDSFPQKVSYVFRKLI